MMRCVFVGVTSVLIALLMPAMLLPAAEAQPVKAEVLVIHTADDAAPKEETSLRLDTGQGVQEIELDTYLTGVVLAEMPASFELEALKAQAVAARTFTLRKMEQSKHSDFDLCSSSGCCQAWIGEEYVEEKLGASWRDYWEKVSQAVTQTHDQVLVYEGELIDAVYFSCSGGMTEEAAAVWGSSVPYLQAVVSPGEETASKYQSQVRIPLDAFQAALRNENAAVSFEGAATAWFGEVAESTGGGVYSMEIGGQSFLGTRLRTLFSLNSTMFTVSIEKDAIVFDVFGYGHRVGMSQYGANAMAKSGAAYDEILLHYYSGVSLEVRQ